MANDDELTDAGYEIEDPDLGEGDFETDFGEDDYDENEEEDF